MKKYSFFFVGLLAFLVMTGCRNGSVNATENQNKVAQMNIIASRHVQTDPALTETVAIVRMNTTTNERGFLRAQASVENFTDERVRVAYAIEWFDADAMVISTAGGGWQQATFESRETRQLVFTAPSADAKDFCIKMKLIEE
jgi:uncharacterized protein YcfL